MHKSGSCLCFQQLQPQLQITTPAAPAITTTAASALTTTVAQPVPVPHRSLAIARTPPAINTHGRKRLQRLHQASATSQSQHHIIYIKISKMEACKKFNYFCYVCGKYTIMPSRRKITIEIMNLYEKYFSLSVICGKSWTPSIVCTTCIYRFNKWENNGDAMLFGVPMIWRDPILHVEGECYACINHKAGMNRRKSASISYTATTYAQIPLPHSNQIPVPDNQNPTEDITSTYQSVATCGAPVSVYQPSNISIPCSHIEISQNRLDIMVRRLKLSQRQSILLAKELKKANILAPDVQTYGAIKRQRKFTTFFTSIENNSLAYCTDIRGLVLTMQNTYNPGDWRLFIDSSKSSLKAVLLHVTNLKSSIPIALSTNTKETYESMKKIMQLIKYEDHNWKICADLKVVAILRGMQLGYTKNMCFMCLWNTRFDGDQYSKRDWPLRGETRLQRNNIIQIPLVPIEKVLLPPLHIKLGIVKNFIKALKPDGNAFTELRRIFPRLSGMKVKEGMN